MKLFLLPLLAALALPTSVNAEIDKKTAEFCLKAADFAGCVETMSGITNNKRLIIDQGLSKSEGNSCPPFHAYIGDGYCQAIGCYKSGGDHDARLGGKGWRCKKNPMPILGHGRSLKFLNTTAVRASIDKNCPLTEPEIGRNNSCQNGTKEAPKDQRIIVPLQGSMD